jgi:hypothetical protein
MTNSPELENLTGMDSVCVGRIVEVTETGKALVDFSLNQAVPIQARSIIDIPFQSEGPRRCNISVLLFLENGDPGLPIIIGIIHDSIHSDKPPSMQGITSATRPQELVLDGKKVVFEAKEEILLCCGKSSITLRKDGKIVLKGTHIVSRASRANKLRGAAVMIN